MFTAVFGQQWSSIAQRSKIVRLFVHTQYLSLGSIYCWFESQHKIIYEQGLNTVTNWHTLSRLMGSCRVAHGCTHEKWMFVWRTPPSPFTWTQVNEASSSCSHVTLMWRLMLSMCWNCRYWNSVVWSVFSVTHIPEPHQMGRSCCFNVQNIPCTG